MRPVGSPAAGGRLHGRYRRAAAQVGQPKEPARQAGGARLLGHVVPALPRDHAPVGQAVPQVPAKGGRVLGDQRRGSGRPAVVLAQVGSQLPAVRGHQGRGEPVAEGGIDPAAGDLGPGGPGDSRRDRSPARRGSDFVGAGRRALGPGEPGDRPEDGEGDREPDDHREPEEPLVGLVVVVEPVVEGVAVEADEGSEDAAGLAPHVRPNPHGGGSADGDENHPDDDDDPRQRGFREIEPRVGDVTHEGDYGWVVIFRQTLEDPIPPLIESVRRRHLEPHAQAATRV